MKAFFKAIIYQPLFNLLIFLVWLMPNNNLGLAIIALTVIMRLIFLPSSLKQGSSQEKLRILQPKIKELQQKHKGDKTAQSKAMIDLYKQAGTSPWGACLPLIIQIVVLILLYRVFQIGLSTDRFDLLYSFVPRPSIVNVHFLGINLAKPDLWVLPIIAGLAQFLQSKLSLPTQKKGEKSDNPMAMATNNMMYIFPVMTVFIARSLPAALAIYWITTSVFMVLQQLYINRVIKPRVHLSMADLAFVKEEDKKMTEIEGKTATPGKGVSVTVRKKK